MKRKIESIRNIGIIAHIDAGKTTVTEHMLFYSGQNYKVGEVDSGTTTTDSDAEEQQRGITIYAAAVTFPWLDCTVNLLDTPGHVDFTAEVERCLRVLDGAVVVFSAREGVEAQSETVWRQADKYQVPRIAFINKMDREGAEFDRVFEEISARLQSNPVAVQIPVGQGPAHTNDPFRGMIDLVSMEFIVFDKNTHGKQFSREAIPEDLSDMAQLWRSQMLEKLYDHSEELMELALNEQPISVELIKRVLREATIAMKIQPVFCGSALHGMGVQPVLDGVAWYLPSPLDRPPVVGKGIDKKKEVVETRKPDVEEPFAGIVFKVLPAKTGDVCWVRVYSGELKQNSRVLNPGKDKRENVSQLWLIHATKRMEQRESVTAGDIIGVVGPRDSITGDTLCDPRHPLMLESIALPETVIAMAIEQESTTERTKLADTLELLKRQDPTLQVKGGDSGQTLISGMGELHLEIIKNRLLRDFNLNVKFHKPQVSYRESVASAATVTGECHRLIGGQQLFAKVRIKIEPFGQGAQSVVVLQRIPPETVLDEYVNVVMDELRNRGEGGGLLASFPLMKLRVTLEGIETLEGQTTDVALRIAAGDAFEKALQAGGKVLLEPIMKLDILTPDDYLGDFVGDLQQRRAIIAKTESRGGGRTFIEAHAPLASLFGYSSAMRSLSQGRAGCSMEPLEYSAAPPEVVKKYEMI